MPIRSSTADFNNLRETATRPITLIRWEHSGGLELISLSGEVEYDGEIYTAGEVNLLSINNNNSATFTMPASTTRINQCLGGTWRGGKICKIYEIAGRIDDEDPVYTADQGFLKIDGIIDDSRYAAGTITVQVLHKYLVSKFTPRYYVSEFTTTIPAPGSFVKVGSSIYQLKARLVPSKFQSALNTLQRLGRLTTAQVNSFSPAPDTLDVEATAEGAMLPIIYGRQPVPGLLCANGTDASSRYVYVVAWAIGPNLEVVSIFNNDAALPAGSIVHNYRGLKCQGVDNYAAGITTPALSYADDWLLTTPAGDVGACYSVIVLPSTTTVAPRFQAIVKGRTVYDPRQDAGGFDSTDNDSLPDPFNQGDVLAVGYNLLFYGTNGTSPTAGMDWSSNHYAITYFGNAQIQSNKLSLDGNGDYVTVASVANTRFGSGKWTLEITCTPTNIAGIKYIFTVGTDAAGTRCIQVNQVLGALYLNMSQDSNTWNIFGTTLIDAAAFAAGVTTNITIEYDNEFGYFVYVNGVQKNYTPSTLDIFASTSTIHVGQMSGAGAGSAFYGTVSGVRFTKGYNRYGGVHVFDSAYTYADWNSNEAGYVYSDTAAGVLADLIKNPYYGLGSTEDIDGLLNLWKFNEADYGGIDRDTVSLVISEKRSTVEWIDLIAGTYAEAFWFVEGAGVTVKPDRLGDANNPSGWELTTNGEFLVDAADWTLGSGWSHLGITDGVLCSASNASISQTLGKPTVAGDVYVITFSLDLWLAGSLRIDLDGITVIEAKTAGGVYTYEFTADGTETTIACVAAGTASALVGEISLRRKYWRDDTLVAGSLTVTPLKNSDSPNRIIASYRAASSTTANWADEVPITISMPGVGIDGTPVIETRIRYDGLKSSIRTTARAKTKLYRLQGKDTVTWITTDAGLLYQRGMIIELYDAEFDLLTYAVLDSIERIEPGRYLCRGDRYSESHYPVDLPTQTGTIPVGLIAPLIGTTVPSGWQAYTPATSPTRSTYYVKCAGESLAVLTAGGATTYAGMSGDTSTDGAHGTTETTFPVKSYTGNSGAGSGALYDILAEEAGDHDHTYATGTVEPDLYTRYFQMVKKITSTSTTWPKECLAFGQADLHYPDMFRYTAYAKRLFAAAATAASSGSLAQMLPITTGSTSDAHDHVNFSSVVNGSPSGTAVTDTHYAADSGGGAHTHAVNLDLDRRVAIHKLSMYGFSVDGGVGPGMIAFWDDTLANLHQDWTLCDGRLGTPFIEGRYLEIAANGEEDEREGNNTLHITGNTSYSAKHEHQGTADTADTYAVKQLSHSEEVRHRHTIQDPATNAAAALHHDWEPPYTTLYPVMYNPNPVAGQRDVQLLIEGDMPAASTTVIDQGPNAYTTAQLGGGSIVYSSTQTLFGLTTLYTTGGRRFNVGTFNWGKKWTIQGFFENTAAGGITYLFSNNIDASPTRSFSVAKNASGNIELYTGTTLRATVTLSLGADEWYYVELSYDYATFRLYAGKTATGTASRATYASAAFDTYPQLGFFDLTPGSAFAGIFPFVGYAGQFRVINGAALNTGSVIAIPTERFDNEFESRHLAGAYNWWDRCEVVNGYYTNPYPDQEQAVLPWNPGARCSLYREVGQANYTVSVDWPGDHTAGQCGPMVLVDPTDTDFALGFNYESALGWWVLWKLGRQPSDIAALSVNTTAGHVDGTAVTLSVEVSGSTITCKVDGVTVITNGGSPTGFTTPAGLVGATRAGVFVDVNLVPGRPANIEGLVAPFTVTKP